jgi:hypothetical protein
MVQRASTYRGLVLEDTLVQDEHSYDGGLAGLLAVGYIRRMSLVCQTYIRRVSHIQLASLLSTLSPVYIG